MYKINIVRSDKVYLGLLDTEYENKSKYFKDNLLKYFKEKFEIQNLLKVTTLDLMHYNF